jgi:hypothetical protein
MLLVVEPLEDDVRILWPYTSAFEGLKDEFFGDRGAPGCSEQRKKVAFLERYKSLGAVEVTRELVGKCAGERFKANNVEWLWSMSWMRRKHTHQYTVSFAEVKKVKGKVAAMLIKYKEMPVAAKASF